MNKFLKYSLLFSLPILIAGVLFETYLRSQPNDYKSKKAYMDNSSEQIETLILGSSHAFRGLDPDIIEEESNQTTYNLSYVSQPLEYDYHLFFKYIGQMPNLKNVVITISDFTYFSNIETSKESWREKNYYIYHHIRPEFSITKTSEVLSNKLKTNIVRLFNNSELSANNKGFGPYKVKPVNEQALLKNGKDAAKRHLKKTDTNTTTNIDYINKIVEECKTRNIKVLIVMTPAYKTYRENMPKQQINQVLAINQSIIQDNNNVVFLNEYDNPNFNASDFFNSDHLNSKGAEKLSIIIAKHLKK